MSQNTSIKTVYTNCIFFCFPIHALCTSVRFKCFNEFKEALSEQSSWVSVKVDIMIKCYEKPKLWHHTCDVAGHLVESGVSSTRVVRGTVRVMALVQQVPCAKETEIISYGVMCLSTLFNCDVDDTAVLQADFIFLRISKTRNVA